MTMNLLCPDLTADMRCSAFRPVRFAVAVKTSTSLESAGDEAQCQQVIVLCDLIHPPDVLLLQDGQGSAVMPQKIHTSSDIQWGITWIATEVLYQF